MTCYTVTTCVISDGSIPSDKGGGGGEFIQTLSPEIRGGAGRSQKNLVKKKRLGGGGWRDPGPTSGSATAISLLWVRCQVRRSRLCGPRSVLATEFFFPLAFRRLQWNSTRGQENTNEKKIESSFCFQVLYKGEIRTIRFVLVECWQRNIFYKKSVMHVQCCCFADLRSRPLESGFF